MSYLDRIMSNIHFSSVFCEEDGQLLGRVVSQSIMEELCPKNLKLFEDEESCPYEYHERDCQHCWTRERDEVIEECRI